MVQDAPLHGSATNSNATKPQTERGNQKHMKSKAASGRAPEGSKGYGAAASPSPSMSEGGSIAMKGQVGSVRPDSHAKVMNHNPYPNGIA